MDNMKLFVFLSIIINVYCSTNANSDVCNEALNRNPNLSPYWILTVISSVPSEINVSGCNWQNLMESRLLNLLVEANSQAIIARRRRRRSVTNGTLRLQLVRAERVDGSTSGQVRVIYYAMQGSSYLRASQAAANVNGIRDRIAIILGYPIDLAAMTYEASLANSSYHLWTIGVVAGVLGGLVVIAWTVLIAYAKCLRPKDHDDVAVDVVAEEFYTDSMRPVAHLNANPKISYSNADIEVIADQVARRLDAHMSEMLQLHHTGGHSYRDLSHAAGAQDPALNDVENGPPVMSVQSEGPKRRKLPRTPSEVDAMEMEPGGGDVLLRRIDSPAVGAQRRPPAKSDSPTLASATASAIQSKSIDRGRMKHEKVERLRNKERLRSRQMSCEDRCRLRHQQMSYEEKISPDEASASTIRLLKTPAESPLQQASAHQAIIASQPQCLWPKSAPQQPQQAPPDCLYYKDIMQPRKPRRMAKEVQSQPLHLHLHSTAPTDQPKPPKRIESMLPPGSVAGCSRNFQLPLSQLSHAQQQLQQRQAHIPAPLGCKVQAVVLPYVSASECSQRQLCHLHHPDPTPIVYGQNIGQQSVTSDDEDAASFPTDTVILKVKRHDKLSHL